LWIMTPRTMMDNQYNGNPALLLSAYGIEHDDTKHNDT
jgi:hypothetical protein